MSSSARDAHRLTPVEVATAGALSGLAVTFGLIAAVTPVFQLFFQVATAVPLAMVSLKLLPRAAVAAFASTLLMAARLMERRLDGDVSAPALFAAPARGGAV